MALQSVRTRWQEWVIQFPSSAASFAKLGADRWDWGDDYLPRRPEPQQPPTQSQQEAAVVTNLIRSTAQAQQQQQQASAASQVFLNCSGFTADCACNRLSSHR